MRGLATCVATCRPHQPAANGPLDPVPARTVRRLTLPGEGEAPSKGLVSTSVVKIPLCPRSSQLSVFMWRQGCSCTTESRQQDTRAGQWSPLTACTGHTAGTALNCCNHGRVMKGSLTTYTQRCQLSVTTDLLFTSSMKRYEIHCTKLVTNINFLYFIHLFVEIEEESQILRHVLVGELLHPVHPPHRPPREDCEAPGLSPGLLAHRYYFF